MKKNAMLKIAAILMVAVLLTTCAISSTFAKYVTSGNVAATTATVAKWGVSVKTNFFTENAGNALFKAEYGTDPDTASASTAHVKAADLTVAPGTSNSVNIESVATGTPEVNGKITVGCTVDLADGAWVGTNGFYCPIIFTIGDQVVNGLDCGSEAEIQNAINEAFALKGVAYFDANENISESLDNLTFGWEWKLQSGESSEYEANNKNDTALGDAETLPTISIGFTVTIEQINAAAPATQG